MLARRKIVLAMWVALAALELPALAATVEPKVQLLVRERPSTGARIVDRVPAGKKLQLLGRSGDGQWAHVQAPKHDGWVPSEQLKGNVRARKAVIEDGDTDGEQEEETVRPLAKRRNVRPEAWVSKSRYHDGEDDKLTISTNKAELYGRPTTGGSVLGILRRGEVVSLVRRSTDKKWVLIDIGGGDVAWIEAKAVKPGAAKAGPMVPEETEEAPVARRERPAREEVATREAEPEAQEAAPEPPVKKTKKQLAAEARAAREAEKQAQRDAEAQHATDASADAKRDEEAAPLTASGELEQPKAKKKRGVRVASRGDLSGLSADSAVTREGPSHGANYFGVGVRGGVAILQQRFTSNATGELTNYESSTGAFGAVVGAGYQRQLGRLFRFGIDGSYTFAGAAGVKYHSTTGSDIVLAVQAHTIDAGLRAGLHFNKIGGVDLALRLGGEMQLNLIQGSSKAPLPSDRILGMTVGLAIDLPALFYLANRAFGLHAYAGGLLPANRTQTPGLEEGRASRTLGAAFGGGLSYQLYKGLALDAIYSYGFAATHFVGAANNGRNSNITSADRGSAQHLISFGLSYNL